MIERQDSHGGNVRISCTLSLSACGGEASPPSKFSSLLKPSDDQLIYSDLHAYSSRCRLAQSIPGMSNWFPMGQNEKHI